MTDFMPYPYIEARRDNIFDREISGFIWHGDIDKPVPISYFQLTNWGITEPISVGTVIQVGPYRLRCIDGVNISAHLVFIRTDTSLAGQMCFVVRGKLLPWYWMVRSRMFRTLAIWNLAELEPGSRPTWRNINVLARVARFVEQAKNRGAK